MKLACTALLFTILSTFTAIAQQNCAGKVVPYKTSIAGCTDSVSVEDILRAGRIESVNKAFTIISFTLSTGGNCMIDGLYTSTNCASASFSTQAIELIKRLPPGRKFYLDCVRVRNIIGQEFFLQTQVMRVRLPSRNFYILAAK